MPREYDAVGNTTAIGTRTFVYTAANRMGQALRDGAVVGEYRYNGRGEQVWRQAQVGVNCTGPDRNREACQGPEVGAPDSEVDACQGLRGRERGNCERNRHQPDNPGLPGGVTVQASTFVYGETGRLLGQYDETGTAQQEVIWLDDLPIGLLAGSDTGTKLFHIQTDHLGTPRVVIDPTRQQAVWTWPLTGAAFGSDTPNQDPDGDGVTFVFDLRFPGQRYDASSGLNYNYFRDYEPATGRYAQSDPIGLIGGLNTYAYVGGMPLGHSDPYGLYWHLVAKAVCDFVAGVGGDWRVRREVHFREVSTRRRVSYERSCDQIYLSCADDPSPDCVPMAVEECKRGRERLECDLEQLRQELGLRDEWPWWNLMADLCNLGAVRTRVPKDPK